MSDDERPDGDLPDLDAGTLPEHVLYAVRGAILSAIVLNAPADRLRLLDAVAAGRWRTRLEPSRDGADVDVLVDVLVDGEWWCPLTRVGRESVGLEFVDPGALPMLAALGESVPDDLSGLGG